MSAVSGTAASVSSSHGVSASTSVGRSKLSSAAQEFESVLLGQWLQDAESSFGGVPGSDDDVDPCGEQMQGFATQRLAGQLTASGGIGIARLVEGALLKASQRKAIDSAKSSSPSETESRVSEEGLAQARSSSSAAEAYSVEAEHEQ
jgi:Rod binding domain-containing protein